MVGHWKRECPKLRGVGLAGASSGGGGDGGRVLWVGGWTVQGLPKGTTAAELRKLFSSAGAVADVWLTPTATSVARANTATSIIYKTQAKNGFNPAKIVWGSKWIFTP